MSYTRMILLKNYQIFIVVNFENLNKNICSGLVFLTQDYIYLSAKRAIYL